MIDSNSSLFEVDVENYNGPLDVLLDLAKTQKVNLEEISITKLADQFNDFILNKKDLNLEIASEYLLMATWLAYLKSKLLLPGDPEEEFKVQEVAEKLKLQLKKLELIRLLSDQMLKRKRLGKEIRTRGMKGNIRSIYSSEYKVNLIELLKTYSTIIMTKDFHKMNIPKLPVFTAEDGIKTIKELFGKLLDWKNINDLIPQSFKNGKKIKRTGKAGIFAGSLELVKEGNLKIKHENIIGAILLKAVGNDGKLKLQNSFNSESILDFAAQNALKKLNVNFKRGGFRQIYGNDETVFEAPGYKIPSITFTRFPFKQYHTDQDKPEIITHISRQPIIKMWIDRRIKKIFS